LTAPQIYGRVGIMIEAKGYRRDSKSVVSDSLCLVVIVLVLPAALS